MWQNEVNAVGNKNWKKKEQKQTTRKGEARKTKSNMENNVSNKNNNQTENYIIDKKISEQCKSKQRNKASNKISFLHKKSKVKLFATKCWKYKYAASKSCASRVHMAHC